MQEIQQSKEARFVVVIIVVVVVVVGALLRWNMSGSGTTPLFRCVLATVAILASWMLDLA